MKAISIIKWVELVGKKEFTVIALDTKEKTYIIYVNKLANSNLYIYFFWPAQIRALLSADVFTIILNKYREFANIF